MRRSPPSRLALVMALFAAPAVAQTPAAATPSAAATVAPAARATTSPSAPKAAAPAPARAGSSPYSEAIQKGDGSFLARDFDAAIAAYRMEIEKNPVAPLGHFRLGTAELAKGNLTEAEIAWQTALRFAGQDEPIRSKILFALADLKERQKANDDAATRWKAYEEHARSHPEAKGYPATAVERMKRAEDYKKLAADSAEVKDRIQKRLQAADDALRKSSK